MPTQKVTVGALAAAVVGLALSELKARLGIDFSPEEQGNIMIIAYFIASYFTPHAAGDVAH